MNDFSTLAATRRSIRKYTDADIPITEIEKLIQIATCAPSGCNSQCWKFVAIKDKAIIEQIAGTVIQKTEALLAPGASEMSETYLDSKRKIVSFFRNAPVVVAVFLTQFKFYDPVMIKALQKQGYHHDDIMELFLRPDLLSIGAAVQNLLLAAHERGYGACWMNEPAVAGAEIATILKMPSDCRLVSIVPIGYPAYTPRTKEMKELSEILTVIDEQ